MMRNKSSPRTGVVVFIVAALILALGIAVPGFGAGIVVNAPHTWVAEANSITPVVLPLSESETRSMLLASKSLQSPSRQVVTQADNGYPRAVEQIKLMSELKDSKPTIVGREIMLVGGGKGLKVLVTSDGGMELVEFKKTMGPDGVLLSSASDLQAIDSVKSLTQVVRTLSPGALPATMNAYVTAYHIGFARPDGTHIVVVVRAGGQTAIEQDVP